MATPRKSFLAQQMQEIVERPRVKQNVKLVAERLGAFRISTGGGVHAEAIKPASKRRPVGI